MRISRLYATAVVAAILAVGAGPATASAQLKVSRAELAPAPRDEAQLAAFAGVRQDMNVLFDAQRAFFAQHGRYAATLAELPGFSAHPESKLVLAVGPDWYVALGGDEQIGTMQHIAYDSDRIPTAALEAARADRRGAVLNPDNTVRAGN
jgi:hypothetical protein